VTRSPTDVAELLGKRFEDALIYASHVHVGQRRKDSQIPYIAHPMSVSGLVLYDGGDEDEAIGALLHDAAEDQGGHERLADIRTRFGDRVALLVEGCSDSLEDPKPPWQERKDTFLERLRKETDRGVLRIALADKVDNTRSMLRDLHVVGDELWSRFNAGRNEQIRYYSELISIFRGKTESPMVDELEEVVGEIRGLSSEAAAG
jgi:(p)ppGpp synthase/HD superfamily hydrolase